MSEKKYYEAYDERYKTAHKQGIRWFGNDSSPIVAEVIEKYHISKEMDLLEIGCGEGRDAQPLLESGFELLATDVSPEVITYCKNMLPTYEDKFQVLDCVRDSLDKRFDFIYAMAVLHMLVLDEDRDAFYRFILKHLKNNGIALICTMGNGKIEMKSDIQAAFDLQEREHEGQRVLVAGTSCRMVSDAVFEKELEANGFEILEKGQTSIEGQFDQMMYAVVTVSSDTKYFAD